MTGLENADRRLWVVYGLSPPARAADRLVTGAKLPDSGPESMARFGRERVGEESDVSLF